MKQTTLVRNSHLSRSSGFTLVELLITIVVIAVLMGISSVAYLKMRESAKSVVSANNLRQWGQALVLYTTDQSGAIPYEGDADRLTWGSIANRVNQTAWFNVLPPYVGQSPMRDLSAVGRQNYAKGLGIHHCPMVEWRDWRRPAFSFMMNSQIYNPNGPSDSPDRPVRLANIAEPESTVMFADLNQSYNDRPRGRGRHVDDRQPGGKVNLVFFDGSMRAFDSDYVRPDTYSGGGVNYSDNNRPNLIWNPWNHPRLVRR